MKIKLLYILHTLFFFYVAAFLAACQSDIEFPQNMGSMNVRLCIVSSDIATRSTPAQIGTPALEKFTLSVSNQEGELCYRDKLYDTDIPLVEGNYNVVVSYGDNPVVGIDAPYYEGTADNVEVVSNKQTQVDVTCSVANSLVSVAFGRNEAERQRFSKFYENYGVKVHADKYYATISDRKSFQSAYFRPGSNVKLEFIGTLKEDGREVSTMLDLSQTEFPATFAPADHAKVTLSLPDPKNQLAIDISAVEVEKVSIQQTIPLDWLPVPQAQVEHSFDAEGCLTGTDISFGNGYPGFEWKAEILNSENNIVRSVQGNGSLSSVHDQEGVEWPYLPAGQYQAHFYIIRDGVEEETGMRSVIIEKPSVSLSVDGYTSYTKYQSGDIDAANACDAFTVYQPSARIGISSALLDNANYTSSIVATLAGSTLQGTRNGSFITYPDKVNLTPSLTQYSLECTAAFADLTLNDSKNLRITGLPSDYSPPSQSEGWTGKGTVAWSDKDNGTPRIRLGQNATSQPHYITSSKFAIPSGTKINCPYKVAVNGATVQTTLTLSVGDYNYFSQKSSYMKFQMYESLATFTLTSDATSVKANNSYGSGQTRSYIYSLSYKYAK